MILIEGNWEEVNDLQDAACLVRSYYNSDLADEIEKLTPIHSDEEYQELLDKVYDLEKENEDLQDENCSLDSENDMLREKIEQLEDMLEN
jgi:predicted nuclease with TOPRIM domain